MKQTQGIYLISVVAETLEMHPQTLRKYERAGFIQPLRMGTLRTYSDEDVARLRLIKHFVDGLGLNLAGVEMALSFASELLKMRMRLSYSSDRSRDIADSIKRIDGMLANLGIRVIKRRGGAGGQDTAPGDGWFHVNPGETVEFG
ncbi:MAG: MerR family transcriptional regulator [Dehalococcoidia bacterium]|nr:MerR family transcriptional regulator [Dehalococcoidia bacterium]